MKSPGWVEEPLANVAHIERDAVAADRIQPGTRYIGLEHIDGEGRISTPQVVENGEIESTKFAFSNRHILYGKLRPYLRKIALPAFEGVCSTDILPIFPKNGKMDRRFLYHYLRQQHLIDLATTRSTGANLPRLSPRILAEFPVTYPRDTAEQRRIAAILDKADAIRRKHEQALALADAFLRSTFLHMFGDPVTNPKGWTLVSLSSFLDSIRYGTNQKCSDSQDTESKPVLRIPNIINGAVNWDDLKFAVLSEGEKDRLRLNDGDILFVRTNGNPEYIGRCAVFSGDVETYYASYLIRARIKQGASLLPAFAKDAFTMPSYRSHIVGKARTTAGNFNIGAEQLKSLVFPLPPLSEQRCYIFIRQRVCTLTDAIGQSAAKANDLFATLSQRAFRGEL